MGRAIIKTVENRAGLQRNMADRIVLAHERLDRLQVVEPHAGLEFDLAAKVSPHQVDVPEPRNLARFDPGDHLVAGQRVGIIRFGSRVDVELPPGAVATVSVGDRVRAGETAIARLAAAGTRTNAPTAAVTTA